MNVAILGRQPEIGLAELERRFGTDAVKPLAGQFAFVDADLAIDELGGVVKTAVHLTTFSSNNPQKAFDYCRRELPKQLDHIPEGKLKLGVSLYGFDMPVAKINANALSLKKAVKNAGRSVRVVPNTTPDLSSAQTYHNKLADELGMELIFIKNGNETVIAQVTGVQNIDAYAARDQARPKTDAFVGMLPPKLALSMVNMAAGSLENGTILDPFCGTGVVLQEASLRGFNVYGTDLSEKMVDYSLANLKWATEKYHLDVDITIHHGDAIETKWDGDIDAVASESYLGQPFSAPPSAEKLTQVRGICNEIISKFLLNLASQTKAGTTVCLAVPAWRDLAGYTTYLPLIPQLEELGYEFIPFKHVDNKRLLYYREDQVVARQLLVLKRR